MQIQFPYKCPRCGARGEMSVDAWSPDPQRVGAKAAQRETARTVSGVRFLLRCPSCGKRPRTWLARIVAPVMVGVLVTAWAFCCGHVLDEVMAPGILVSLILGAYGQLKSAGRVTAIQLAAPIPQARALALPDARPASGAEPPTVPPEPDAEPSALVASGQSESDRNGT